VPNFVGNLLKMEERVFLFMKLHGLTTIDLNEFCTEQDLEVCAGKLFVHKQAFIYL